MCGFVVFIGKNGRAPEPSVVARMTATLVHRGPDDSGFWNDDSVAIGFRRLAIIDLSPKGHQPMVSCDGAHVIAFNGEIFNYVELRDELRALGHRFASATDTEVLLAAWREWGDACVDRLEGMFAFVIWDRNRREAFGARDRFGVKPLYFHDGADAVIFASEIKAIHASGECAPRPNWPVLARYLVEGHLDDSPATSFVGIEQIPPSHAFHAAPAGGVRQYQYFHLPTILLEEAADGPEMVAGLLETAVRMRMRSDVPLGVSLSGGLDSTAIICAMARHRRQCNDASPLLAFNYNDSEFDESPYVSETLKQTGAKLVPWEGRVRDLWENMSRVLHFHDEPIHSLNALITFDLMRMAREHGVIVLLNGHGADEVLAGYSSYFLDYWAGLALSRKHGEAWRQIQQFSGAVGTSAPGLMGQVVQRLAFGMLAHVPGYQLAARVARRTALRRNRWFAPDLTAKLSTRRARTAIRLDTVQRNAIMASPLPLYLRIEDRNSMAHSVEARVPFLDHRLVSYSMTLPLTSRIRGPWNKHMLREATRGRIPEVVRTRADKMGFPTPGSRWFAQELYEPLRDLLGSQAARQRGLYRPDNMLDDLDAARGHAVPEHNLLFRAANVEVWLSMIANRSTP
ncbi:MAG: asparagine synthase (glutamine-hydrolyzing) [Gemmatimonadaceae bacterium]